MNYENPLVADYKLLVVFRNMGSKLLQQLKEHLLKPPYNSLFKDVVLTNQHDLLFTYLGHAFSTRIEVFFNYSRMPKSAFIATYPAQPQAKLTEEMIRYSFDLDYMINDMYTLDDFAEYYIIEFHQNLKKTFSEHHMPFPVRITEK